MNLELLFFGIVPIVLYVFVDLKYGMKAGIYTAIASAIVLGIYFYLRFGQIDEMLIVDAGFIIGLGLLSIKLNNSRLFKLQPCIIGTIICGYVGYLQFFSEPILVRYMSMMESMAPELAQVLAAPQAREYFALVSSHLLVLFVLHTIAVGFAAVRLSNMKWMLVRLSIYPLLFGLIVVDQLMFGHMLIGSA